MKLGVLSQDQGSEEALIVARGFNGQNIFLFIFVVLTSRAIVHAPADFMRNFHSGAKIFFGARLDCSHRLFANINCHLLDI